MNTVKVGQRRILKLVPLCLRDELGNKSPRASLLCWVPSMSATVTPSGLGGPGPYYSWQFNPAATEESEARVTELLIDRQHWSPAQLTEWGALQKVRTARKSGAPIAAEEDVGEAAMITGADAAATVA